MHLASVLVLFLFLLFFVPKVNQTPTTSQPPKPHSQCFRYPDGVTVVWTCCRRNIALPADWLKAWLVCVEMILTLGSNPLNHLTILWFLDLTNTHWPGGCPAKTTAFWLIVILRSPLWEASCVPWLKRGTLLGSQFGGSYDQAISSTLLHST